MDWRKVISLSLGIITVLVAFIFTYIEFPTSNIFRILGQFVASLSMGAIVLLVTWGLLCLWSRITR